MESNDLTREDRAREGRAYVYATMPYFALALTDKDYVFSEEDRRIQEVAKIAYERGGEDEYKLLTKWNDGSISPEKSSFYLCKVNIITINEDIATTDLRVVQWLPHGAWNTDFFEEVTQWREIHNQ